MKKLLEKIVLFLMALILVVWAGYHIIRYTNESLELETVFQETIPRSLTGRGIAIREELTLGYSGEGEANFLYQDAARVGIDQPVAEYYSGDVKNRNTQDNIRALEQEISMLESAQNKNANNYSSAPIISRDIREQLALLTQMSTTGKCTDISTLEDDLSFLVNRRYIAIGKGDNFSPRISELKSELLVLRESSQFDDIKRSTAPVSGYFAKNNDGLENSLNFERMKTLGVNDYLSLIEIDLSENRNQTGRLVTESRWYFAVCLPAYKTEWVWEGQRATMTFSQFSGGVQARVSEVIIENNNNTAVIILTSDFITEDIINLRTSDVTLSFSNFTGLKINTIDIRFKENEKGEMERGVYVLENYVVKFKKINVIYEENSFVISKMNYANSSDKENVRLFDQIIVRGGTDIYDGKVIQ